MASNKKRYGDRKPWTLEPHYSSHVSAMTSEGLHAKAAIAAELAFRDVQIAKLREAAARVLAMHDGPPDGVGNWDWAFDSLRMAIKETEPAE